MTETSRPLIYNYIYILDVVLDGCTIYKILLVEDKVIVRKTAARNMSNLKYTFTFSFRYVTS